MPVSTAIIISSEFSYTKIVRPSDLKVQTPGQFDQVRRFCQTIIRRTYLTTLIYSKTIYYSKK
jgi:hypothetical protein